MSSPPRTSRNPAPTYHTPAHPGHPCHSRNTTPTHPPANTIQHGLLHHLQREQLWKGAWTTDLITSLAYNARAHARSRPWQSLTAKAQLTTILKSIGALTTTYTLNAWKHRRRAAIQIHQQIQRHANPASFDHTPRLSHTDKIKYSDPILTELQLQDTLHRLLRLNPTRPYATSRTFGRRRAHQQQMPQPSPPPAPPQPSHAIHTNQFTIRLTQLPQHRLTQSLIHSLPYCVCCLCNQNHTDPTCPPHQTPLLAHRCHFNQRDPEDIDPTFPHHPAHTDWTALHWTVWHSSIQHPDQPTPPTATPTPTTHTPPPVQTQPTQPTPRVTAAPTTTNQLLLSSAPNHPPTQAKLCYHQPTNSAQTPPNHP
jgi:hypothetical protein